MISYKELTEIGFSSKEAKVYLASLELGPSTATQISRKAKINRTTSYDILESLAGNGLVNLLAQAKVQKFSAESPQKVLSFLENKIKEGQEKLSAAYSLVPQLLSVYNTKKKPKVRFYEGIDGVREAFEDTLTAKEDIRAYAVGEDMFKVLSKEYFREYFKKRVEKNIGTRVIAPDTLDSRMVSANDKKEMRTSILVPRDKFYFSVETNIYDNKIMILSWRGKFAVIIESEEIADAQKKTFELAWEGAKNYAIV
ncbi:MAG: helix-turn-helix domain-containing protein [bacterium]